MLRARYLTSIIAKFLFSLGLRRYPPLEVLLKLSTDQDEALRSTALRYFLDNTAKYEDYDPDDFSHIAFIPALRPNGEATLGMPGQVFIDSEASMFGFLVVQPSFRNDARDKLKLKQYPPASLIMPILETSSPQDPSVARPWFEALAGRITGERTYLYKMVVLSSIQSRRLYSQSIEEAIGASYRSLYSAFNHREEGSQDAPPEGLLLQARGQREPPFEAFHLR